MKKYRYVAKTEDGTNVRGSESAQDEEELYRKLRGKGLYLISSHAQAELERNRRLKKKELADFARELGTLLHAGVPLIRALAILAQAEDIRSYEKKILEGMLRQLRQGDSFSDAVAAQGNAFPELMVHMLRIAEAGGRLDEVCARLAVHYEKEHRMNSKIRSAMTYPAILGVVMVVVVMIIFTYVMPQFSELFEGLESLPASTKVLLRVSEAVRGGWPQLLAGIVLAVLLIRLFLRIPQVRYQRDRLHLGLPVVGRLLRRIYTARFARTLSSLYASGLPMLQAIQVSSRTIGNSYIEQQFPEALARIRKGESMSAVLGDIDGFVKKFSATVLVGEETGSLDEMLDSMADALDFDSERAIGQLIALLEPAMIVVMAIAVGFIMISVLGPIYGSYDAIGSFESMGV